MSREILLFAGHGRKISNFAAEIARTYIQNLRVVYVEREGSRRYENVLKELSYSDYEAIISFLCPKIIPDFLLKKSKLNVNFHPGNAQYPGIGCFNFALYECVDTYGVCCHHMEAAVDAGRIIYEQNFPISQDETVETLQLKAWATLIEIFNRFLRDFSTGQTDFSCNLKNWKRKPFTRRQLNDLAKVDLSMSKKEILKRIRATSYPAHLPRLIIGTKVLSITPDPCPNNTPLAERVFD